MSDLTSQIDDVAEAALSHLAELAAEIKDRQKIPTWGAVADLVHVRNELAELLRFTSSAKSYEKQDKLATGAR